jgi:hypothetical protein
MSVVVRLKERVFAPTTIGLTMSVTLDAILVALFFIDGRAAIGAFLRAEFADYAVATSVADLLVLAVLRSIALMICYRSFGVLHPVPTIVRGVLVLALHIALTIVFV